MCVYMYVCVCVLYINMKASKTGLICSYIYIVFFFHKHPTNCLKKLSR